MADKDWIKSFPPGFRSFAIQISEGNWEIAEVELELRAKIRVIKDCQDIIEIFRQLSTDIQNIPKLDFTVEQIDRRFDEKIRESSIATKPSVVKLAKNAWLTSIKDPDSNNLFQDCVSQLVESYLKKEITDKFHNVSPKDPIYKGKVQSVKKMLLSAKTENIHKNVTSKITIDLIKDNSSSKNNINQVNDEAQFNFYKGKPGLTNAQAN
ncbi:MAG: hypothetical protein CK427_17160 [Leptospira sp.]|nr:MAG: hypothetical protein CK427_17160 [Leptospira sp.]